jgi:hypothetical protein
MWAFPTKVFSSGLYNRLLTKIEASGMDSRAVCMSKGIGSGPYTETDRMVKSE